MKRIALFATLALVIGLFATQAFAWRGGGGYGCPGWGGGNGPAVTAEQSAEYEKFYEATKDLRSKLVADRAELQALMRADNPDATRVRALAESINETREQLVAKAEELNIQAGPGYGCPYGGQGRGWGHRGYGHMGRW